MKTTFLAGAIPRSSSYDVINRVKIWVVKITLRVGESTGTVYNVTGLTVELKPPSGWLHLVISELR